MPGRLGPRPSDWDEPGIRASPTFLKWMALQPGQSLRYACLDFVKGYEDDEERLMRRIMIARRNNLKDHELLKRARAKNNGANEGSDGVDPSSRPTKRQKKQHRKPKGGEDATTYVKVVDHANDQPSVEDQPIKHGARKLHTDVDILNEMDVDAVEATRSYKKWAALPMGTPFVYNQMYIKGEDGHDWLLKKNIWRRMRYRRRNRDKVDELTRVEGGGRSKRSPPCRMDEIRAQTGRIGVGANVWITQDTTTTTTAAATSIAVASAAINASIPRKKVKVDTRKKLKVTNGMDEDESALVSRAVRDAAAVAQQLELGLAVGLDAVAVAALDDPMVVSALDAAAQLAAVSVEVPTFGQSASV